MIALDTDVLSEILLGKAAYVQRLASIPEADRSIPVVALEEVLRGRLDAIRQAQAGRVNLSLTRAYEVFADAIEDTKTFSILPYTAAADTQFKQWRAAKIRVGTQDLRIAAICLHHNATLVTRNARDYKQIPGLTLDVWN